MADPQDGRALISAITGSVVKQVAPEEEPLFDTLIADYFAHPAPPTPSDRSRDSALGFGVGEVLSLATPAAAAAVTAALSYIAGEAVKTLQEQGAELVKQRIRDFFQRNQPATAPGAEPATPGAPPSLDRAELRQVYEVATREAVAFGISQEQAARMATVIVGSLALSAGAGP